MANIKTLVIRKETNIPYIIVVPTGQPIFLFCILFLRKKELNSRQILGVKY